VKFLRILSLIVTVFLLAFSAVSATQAAPVGVELSSARSAQVSAKSIHYIAFAPKGGYAILFDKFGYSTNNVPKTFNTKLKEFNTREEDITSVSFTADGKGWVIVGAKTVAWEGIPDKAAEKIKELAGKDSTVKQVVLGPKKEWLVLFDSNGYSSVGLAKGIVDALKEVNTDEKEIKQLSFSPTGEYVLLYGRNGYFWSTKIPADAVAKLEKYNADKLEIIGTAFGEKDAWAIITDEEVSWGDTTVEFADEVKALLATGKK
jgi:hypothetical protein